MSGAGGAAGGELGQEMSGAGGGTEPCSWSGNDGLIAEWRANGNLDNEVACSPLAAELLGRVDYGPGREAEAWRLRSTWSEVLGGDPNFVNLKKQADVTLPQVTVDVWIQQTGFNDYNNSNRIVFSTSYRSINGMLPGEAQLYLHENKGYYAHFTTGLGGVDGSDFGGCYFPSVGPLELLAPLDTWFRLSFSYDGASVRCYLNGELDSESALPMLEQPSSDLAPLIGRNFPGDVDALRLFNRALSADELRVPWP